MMRSPTRDRSRVLIGVVCLLVAIACMCTCGYAAEIDVLPGDVYVFPQDTNREANKKLNTRIASNGEGYLCVWQEHIGGERAVYAQRLDQEGAVQGDPVAVGSIAGNLNYPADVGSDGDRYLVVWTNYNNDDPNSNLGQDIYGAFVSAQGSVEEKIVIATGAGSQTLPKVKWRSNHYLVVWEDWTKHETDAGKVSLYGKRLDADGTILDQDPLEITTDMAYNKTGRKPCFDIASCEDPNGISWIVAWSGSVQDPAEYGLDILARFLQVDPNGTLDMSPPLPAQIPITGLNQYNPTVEGLNNQFLVVWEQSADDEGSDTDIWGIMLNIQEGFAGGLINISPDPRDLRFPAPEKQQSPELSSNGSGFFVVWLDQRDSTSDKSIEHIYGTRISPEGFLLQDDSSTIGGTRLSEDPNQIIWLTDVAAPGGEDDRYFCLWSAQSGNVWTLRGRMYDPPPPPWLEWEGTGDFKDDGVNPDKAAGGSTFTFKVKYFSDPNINEAPEIAQVLIDLDGSGGFGSDERFDMSAEGSGDFNLSRVYALQKKILYDGEGILAYRFFFADPYNVATGNPAEGDTFEVELVGKRPTLDWTEEVGFTADGARPDGVQWGESASFEFRVLYQDENNDAPATKKLWVDRNADGYYDPNEVWDMEASGSDDYQNGEIFTKSLTLGFNAITSMAYRFEFDDGKNRSTGEPRSGSYLGFNPLGETAACLNTHNQLFPAITTTLSGYQVFWQDSRDWDLDTNDALIVRSHIYMELLDEGMQVMDDPNEPGQIKLDTGDMGAFKPSAIHSKATGKTLVIWEDLRNGSTKTPSAEDENYFKPERIYDGLDIYGIFLDEDGTAFTDTSNANEAGEFLIAGSNIDKNMLNPAMAMGENGQYLVAWEDETRINFKRKTDIYARFVEHPGGASGEIFPLQINNWVAEGGELGDEHQLLPRVARNDEYYMVVWQDIAGASQSTGYRLSRVYGMRISPEGELYPEGVGFKLFDEDTRGYENDEGVWIMDPNKNQLLPDIASDGNDFLVVWQDDRFVNTERGYDIKGMRFNSNGEALDLPFKEIDICTADGHQVRPRVVWDPQGSQYLITWLDLTYKLAPEDMLAHRFPRTGNVRVVRMDPNGQLLDGSPGTNETYEGTQPVGISLTQDRPAMTCDSASGCAFIWEDIRNSRSYDLYTASFQSTLNWVDDDDYGDKGVHPDSAAPGETFTFKVHYRDRLNTPPAKAQVWIDLNDDGDFEDEGEQIDMEPEDPNATIENGRIYSYSTTIDFPENADGVLAYRFYFEDEDGNVVPGIGSGPNFLTLTITEAPQLDWAGGTGFTSDGVEPNIGDSGSLFVFKVEYTDPANIKPEVASIWLDIDDSGTYGSTEKLVMKEEDEDDKDYSDGKIYTFSAKLTYRGDGIIKYRFYFHNGALEAEGDPTEDHTFRINEPAPTYRWQVFYMGGGPAGNYVTALDVSGDNVLWAGFYPDQDDPENSGGVSSYDGKVWRTFREGSGLPSNAVLKMAITPDDDVWVGTGEGIARYDGSQWKTELDIVDPNSFVSALVADTEGRVWFSTFPTQDPETLEISDTMLTKYEDGAKTPYPSKEKLGGNWITALAADLDGLIWAGVTDVSLDANQIVVFDYKGIVVFDPNAEEKVEEYSKSKGTYPGGDLVRTIYIDDEGDVWVGSQDPGTTTDYSVPLAMGLSHFDAQQETWTQYKDGVGNVRLGSNMVTAVYRRGNDLYLGHWPESETLIGGATRYNLASKTWQLLNNQTEAVDASFNAINDIVIDQDSIVWFGSVNGLYRFDPNGTIIIPIGPKPKPYQGLFDPNEDNGCFIAQIEDGRHGGGGVIIPLGMVFCLFLMLIGFLCARPRTLRKGGFGTRMPAESNRVNKDCTHQ